MNGKHSDFYASDKTCNAGKVCKELFDSYSYDQLISEPTRFSGNSQSCIDILFTNRPTNVTHFFDKIGTEPPLPNCDHVPITAVLNFKYRHDSSLNGRYGIFKKPILTNSVVSFLLLHGRMLRY